MWTLVIGLWFFILIAGLLWIDQKKKRLKAENIPISVFIPCYNDAGSIWKTLHSLYTSYPKNLLDVIVINDKSTDNSGEVLSLLKNKYPFTLYENSKNLGKVATLNKYIQDSRNETLLILDADMEISKRNFEDMLKRKQGKVVAVSCPYYPLNKGFRAMMQSIEYVMMRFLQGAYNPMSAISLRGGCIMVEKSAFLKVGKFSKQAIIEDTDLAFKLNKAGYNVEQSLVSIGTIVPGTFLSRWRQKIRRGSGGMQCFIKYRKIWIKNPLHILFLSFFCLTVGFSAFGFVKDWLIISTIVEQTDSWMSIFFILSPRWRAITIFIKLGFTLFSLPYVIPLVKHWKESWKLLLIIPFSLFYIPLFSLVNVVWWGVAIFKYRKLEKWKTRWW